MRNILVIVDAQNDFISGSLGSEDAKKTLSNILKYIENVPKDCLILSTFDTHYDNYLDTLEGKKLPVPHCRIYSEGWEQPKELKEALVKSENICYKIFKETFSGGENIKNVETTLKYFEDKKTFYIMGYCTDICVVSTALSLKALYPDSEINIIKDCCAGTTKENHEAALKVLKSCQCNII